MNSESPDLHQAHIADTPTDEGRLAQRLEAKMAIAYDIFTNPTLKRQLEQLTPQEKAEIDELVEELVIFDSYFTAKGKPHGIPTFEPERGVEHRGYTINSNPHALHEFYEQGGQKLVMEKLPWYLERYGENLKFMSEAAQQILTDEGNNKNFIKIIPVIYSTGEIAEDLLMLKCHLMTPDNTSLHDPRGSHNYFTLRVPAKGKVIEALRSGKADNFIFALRNAGVIINPDAAVMLDAPMGLPGASQRFEESLSVVDLPSRTIIDPRTKPLRKTTYGSDEELLRGCVNRQIVGYNKPTLGYTYNWGGDLSTYSRVEQYRKLNPKVDLLR